MRLGIFVWGILCSSFLNAAPAVNDPLDFVDPLIGTSGGGNVTPGPLAPFGMIQWSPDTPDHPTSNYEYTAGEIQGFSLTHLSGTGCPNFAEFPILPTINDETRVGFQHQGEAATPGYYRVPLANGVTVELTSGQRAALGRFTFRGRNAVLSIDAGHAANTAVEGELHALSARELGGYTRNGHFCGSDTTYTVYLAARADRDFVFRKQGAKARLAFAAPIVHLKVAISYVSEENARRNLATEIPAFDFEALRERTRAAWREKLAAVAVEGGPTKQKRVFYTALYHSLLHPNIFSDVNGEYRGFDGQVHALSGGETHYANFSGWDVYRSQLPLVSWLFPELGSQIAASLVRDAEQCGALPKWGIANVDAGVMIGDPGAAAVSAIHAFGGRAFDTAAALRFMRHGALDEGARCNQVPIRPSGRDFRERGFVPHPADGVWGSVSTTEEYAIADSAIASFAKRLGDDATYQTLRKSAGNWRNLFDAESKLIRARDVAGRWVPGVNESTQDGYVEGNAAQFRWLVPQDPRGLIESLGGGAAAVPMLDRFFTRLNVNVGEPYFFIGNENGFATPWLYLWAGAPARTQDVVRRVIEETFDDRASGLPGNDDLGATSAWLVWSALGLYPAVPGEGMLAVGSPLFPRVVLSTRKLTIEGLHAPDRFVADLELDNQPIREPFLSEGKWTGTLKFTLDKNSANWGKVSLTRKSRGL